jgi:hypothetical protein
MARWKGSGLVLSDQTDLGSSPNDDVMATDVRRTWETITLFVNVYEQRNMQSRERPAKKWTLQRANQQSSTVPASYCNSHSI